MDSTGVERITLSRTSAAMLQDPGLLRVSMRAKKRPAMRVILTAWLLLWLATEAALVLPLVNVRVSWGAPSGSPEASLLLIVLVTAAGLVLAFRLAWRLFGEEVLFISPQILRVRRAIGPFHRTREFPFRLLEELQLSRDQDARGLPSWGRMFIGRQGNAILFRYRGRTHQIARELDTAEAAYLLNVIQLWTQTE